MRPVSLITYELHQQWQLLEEGRGSVQIILNLLDECENILHHHAQTPGSYAGFLHIEDMLRKIQLMREDVSCRPKQRHLYLA